LSHASPLAPCPHGMSTREARHFIVYRKPDHSTRFWMTHDGRRFVGTSTLVELARELAARRATWLYALPLVGPPTGSADLTLDEGHKLLTWLKIGAEPGRKA
jgi:hypothetical protein